MSNYVDHEQRALKWFIYLVVTALGVYFWYEFILPSPWGLVWGTEFWVDWRVYCFPCLVAGEPWGPNPTESVARINSILGALVLWVALVFIWIIQILAFALPFLYGLYWLSKWVSGDLNNE